MNCPNCSRPLTPLFLTLACDFCDARPIRMTHTGWVVWQGWATHYRGRIFQHWDNAETKANEYVAMAYGWAPVVRQCWSSIPIDYKSSDSVVVPEREYNPANHTAWV